MGLITNQDPRPFRQEPRDIERRFEEAFSRIKKARLFAEEQQGQTNAAFETLQKVLDAKPNSTSGAADRELTLAGSRGIRGRRIQKVMVGDDAFTEWTTGVAFVAAYPTPPVVVVTPLSTSGDTLTANLLGVTNSGFTVRLTAQVAQTRMDFHFQAWGDDD